MPSRGPPALYSADKAAAQAVHRGREAPRLTNRPQRIDVHFCALAAEATVFSMKRTPRAPSSMRG